MILSTWTNDEPDANEEMDSATRQEQLRRYFERPKPVPDIWTTSGLFVASGALVATFLVIIFGFNEPALSAAHLPWYVLLVPSSGGVLASLFFFGRLLLNRIKRSKLTDENVDRMILDGLHAVETAAHEELGLRKRQDLDHVVQLVAPYISAAHATPAVPARDMKARRGEDGQYRFSAYEFSYLYPTLHHLSLFTTQYNLLTDRHDQGQEMELLYRHIVSVQAGPVFGEVSTGREIRGYVAGHWFRLLNTGGGEFKTGVAYGDLDKAATGESVKRRVERGELVAGLDQINSDFTSARKRIRDVLREKEEAAQFGPPRERRRLRVDPGKAPHS